LVEASFSAYFVKETLTDGRSASFIKAKIDEKRKNTRTGDIISESTCQIFHICRLSHNGTSCQQVDVESANGMRKVFPKLKRSKKDVHSKVANTSFKLLATFRPTLNKTYQFFCPAELISRLPNYQQWHYSSGK
jgi:hypothetical protein